MNLDVTCIGATYDITNVASGVVVHLRTTASLGRG